MPRYVHFSPELLEEIMSWLPPESLKRFKLVQRSWYLRINALMDDKTFIAKHHRNMKSKMSSAQYYRFRYLMTIPKENGSACPAEKERVHDKRKGKRVQREDEDEDLSVLYFLVLANEDHDGTEYILCDTEDLRKLTGYMGSLYFKMGCQCDGVICLSDNSSERDTIYLMNPGLREMRIIQCPRQKECNLRGLGFGYDSRANEYKVVAFFSRGRLYGEPCIAKVYSLSGDSWRDIELGVEISKNFDSDHGVVYCNGVCYWYYKDWSVMRMFSFDFGDELFRDVSVPVPDVTGERNVWNCNDFAEWTKISVWKESPVVFTYSGEGLILIDMWVLDSGGEGSGFWTKHLTIGPLEGIYSPIGFWNDFELFMEAKGGVIKFYHLHHKVVNRVYKKLDWFLHDRFVIYRKSLVSVLRKEGRRSVVQM